MKFEYFIHSNNITYKEGDTLLLDFTNDFINLKSIDNLQFDFTPIETSDINHNIYLRWSYNILESNLNIENFQTVWSSWIQIAQGGVIIPEILDILSKLFRKDPDSFKLQFKLIRKGSTTGSRSIDKLTIDYTPGKLPEGPETSLYPTSQQCGTLICTPAQTFGSGILIDSNCGLFRPYDLMKPAQALYTQMSCASAEMFGHCVRYFKTTPKEQSSDKVLKEYSLFNVTDVKDIKILIPDNELPDNAIQFMPYDMDFSDSMECHIVKSHFERAFGQYRVPEEKDYIYFPLTDRLYEVHSAYMFKDFMGMDAYYKIRLFKWQDKKNVMRENPELDMYVDDLHDSFESLLNVDVAKESLDVTKSTQYKTIAVGGHDHIRSHINDKLNIVQRDLTNYYTIVSKNYYDLKTGMNPGDVAVQYKIGIDRSYKDNTAYTMWFSPKRSNKDAHTADTLIDCYYFNETDEDYNNNKGIFVKINYSGLTATTVDVKINKTLYTFENLPLLSNDKWYGFCLNVQSEFKQISLFLWSLKYNPNQPSQNRSTDLLKIYNKTLDYQSEDIITDKTVYKLRAGSINLTNFRIWSESIEEEKQPIILNQYVVNDQQRAMLIDNALAPLRLDKSFIR